MLMKNKKIRKLKITETKYYSDFWIVFGLNILLYSVIAFGITILSLILAGYSVTTIYDYDQQGMKFYLWFVGQFIFWAAYNTAKVQSDIVEDKDEKIVEVENA
jgi:ABC-type iron transport system FetAB permease component